MKFFILGLLLREPLTLYDLHRRFAAGLGHIYAASYGSIHRALRQLDEAGDVVVVASADTVRGKKRYRATVQGRRTWRGWMTGPQPTEDVELAALARVFLLGELDRPAQRRAAVLALHRRAIEQHADLQRVRDDLADRAGTADEPADPAHYPMTVLAYGLRSGQALVDWLEQVLAELPDPDRADRPGATGIAR